MTSQISVVSVADIVRDPQYQVRRKLTDSAIQRYAAAYKGGEVLPPVRVGLVGGTLVLIDGWHRLAALDQLGRLTVTVELEAMTDVEAGWQAAAANLHHGVPLKASEFRGVFRAYVASGRHETRGRPCSYRDLAVALGGVRSHTTLRNWMRRDFPWIARRMGGEPASEASRTPAPDDHHEERLCVLIQRHIEQVAASSRGVHDAERRGAIVLEIERLLADVREWKPWTEARAQPPDDF